ncbi:acetyltransferase [Actinoplanes sp. NPDC051861]|uniref:acetyltransferase n=1 Tax=Actinoplanes sp. NPDC051861 TaxID=3155170 RepID=UPI0034295958
MTDLIVRPLTAGEEQLFDSMPDPLPELRQVSYADGLAGGGYRPEHTWVALRDGRVVARAAWLLPPGAVGEPWLERFEVAAEPEVGATLLRAAHEALGGPKIYYAAAPAYWRRRTEVREALSAPMTAARLAGLTETGERLRLTWTRTPLPAASGRYTFRAAESDQEVEELVARMTDPAVLTGVEMARTAAGVDLARDPLKWVSGTWRVALDSDVPVGLAGPTGDACYPMIAYLGVLEEAALSDLVADAAATLEEQGAYEVVADVDAHRVAVVADLERLGFRRVRSRVAFMPE